MAQRYFKSMLVGIEFPGHRQQPALQRAAQLAQRTGARLTLFHAAFSQFSAGPQFYGSAVEKSVKKTLAERRAILQKLAAPLRRKGLKVTVKVAWDYPAYEAIVREAQRSKPDLVVAESHRRTFGARLFLTNTDWQLIRLCPVPLLFVKKQAAYGKTRVLAAVDPLHLGAKPAQLDQRILRLAQALTSALDGQLDVVHAHMPLYSYTPSIYGEAFTAAVDPKLEQKYRRNAQRALERVAARLELPPGQLHLQTGEASSVLPSMARKLHADVLVMGAVSRSGLDRLFIGSTAERCLDRLPCDVLVVKPRGYKSSVSRRYAPLQLDIPPM